MAGPQDYPEAIPYVGGAAIEVTAGLRDDQVRHLSCFDPELVPGTPGIGALPALSNGRQLAQGADGWTYLLIESAQRGLMMAAAAPGESPIAPAPFASPMVLVGVGEQGELGRAQGEPGGGSLAIDATGRAALTWHDEGGVRLACGMARAGRIAWDGPCAPGIMLAGGARAGDLAFDAGGRLHVLTEEREGITHRVWAGREVASQRVADQGSGGAIAIGADGDVHVAYQCIQTRSWRIGTHEGTAIDESIRYCRRRGGRWSATEQVAWPITLHPSLVLWRGCPLVVFQTEGVRRVQPRAADYLHQREGGGGGVGFAVRGEDGWRVGTVARPEEILVADQRERDAGAGRVYPMVEEMFRPVLIVDNQGVPWVVWPNLTRRHTYASRWLGREFSVPQEVRGGWAALSPLTTAAREMAGTSTHLPIVTAAAGRLFSTPVVVPRMNAAAGHAVLFLDLLEVAEMDGLEHGVSQLRRYEGNPVFTPAPSGGGGGGGAPGAWDDLHVACPAVWWDGGRYLMQYQGRGTLLPGTNTVTGLAESPDGVHWTRPSLGVVDIAGQPDNNCIPWIYFFRDGEEPDVQKRYKGARTSSLWTKDLRRTLVTSPDAIHWTEAGEAVNLHCMHEANGPSFRDPYDIPARRFKAVGRTCCDMGRTAGIMWSADCLAWQGYEATLDNEDPYGRPAVSWRGRYNANPFLYPSGERTAQQIYWNTTWPEHGFYFCLYGPMHWDGGFDIALAVSRDCRQWTRVCGGRALLERQAVGCRESGSLFVNYGNARPVRFDDRLRVYYSSGVRHHGTEPHATHCGSGIGFAELDVDRWASLRLERDAEVGRLTTIPVDVPPGAYGLELNATGQAGGAGAAGVSVAVVDAQTMQPLSGYGHVDCTVASGTAIWSPVRWRGGPLRGAARLRVQIEVRSPRVRLYGLRFNTHQ